MPLYAEDTFSLITFSLIRGPVGGTFAGDAKQILHLGLTILSLDGRLIHSWKPCSILSSVGAGISLWMMPRPAVIHWTPPGPITPCRGNFNLHASS